MKNNEFIIVTGSSGAGKSTVLKDLEELDFFCVDNLPPALLQKFAQLCESSGYERVAVAVDDSQKDFVRILLDSLQFISACRFSPKIVFLEASDDILVRRFSANYRKHPLTDSENRMLEAIRKEKTKQEEIRGFADIVLDTGDKTLRQLKDEITRLFSDTEGNLAPITATILSFGYKFGLPRDADIVFDARVLPNPFYNAALQPLDGNAVEIQDFVFSREDGGLFMEKIYEILALVFPMYISKGKSHLTIAVGCTGGRHRSVAVALRIADFLKGKNYRILRKDRDIDKDILEFNNSSCS